MLCLFHYGPALLRFDFKLTSDTKIQPVVLKLQAGKTFSYHGHALIMLYVQLLCSDWSKFESEFLRKIMHRLKTCLLRQLKLAEFWDNFNCLFPLDKQNEKQLLSKVSCY